MSAPLLDHLAVLESVQADFAAELAAALPARPVPTCGSWTATELGLHLAGIHRWAADIVGGHVVPDKDPTEPREPTALVAEYVAAAAHVRSVLATTAPDAPCQTLVGPGVAAFWHRRQVHETLVHLADLTLPVGRVPNYPDEVWADTVDEVVTMMAPRQVNLGRTPALISPVALVSPAGAWVLGHPATGGSGDGTPVATVTAPASVLALLLWRRLPVTDERVHVAGDAAAAQATLDAALTP